MKIVTKPTVEVIAMSKFIGSTTFEIPDDGDDHTKIGSFAAKVCYDSSGKNGRSNEANQTVILESKHGSVLEHMSVSLYITGITRGLTLELNRHRTFGISQRSTRYTAEEDAAIVLEPFYAQLYEKYKDFLGDVPEPEFTPDMNMDELNLLLTHLGNQQTSLDAYQREMLWLQKNNLNDLSGTAFRKWARGKARNVLPHGLESRGVWTNNHRGWRWFIESRSNEHAEPEIRRLADVVLTTLRSVAPLYYNDFKVIDTYDDIPVWKPDYSKI